MNSPILEVHNLSQAYSNRVILKDIDLSIHESEVITLLGPNGVGKTTLLRVLCGLVRPFRGKVSYKKSQTTSLHTPDCSLYHDLTLKENLALFQSLYQTNSARYERLIQSFGLKGFLTTPVRQLSHGQKLRGDLCRALMQETSLYLLDEPLVGLDQSSATHLLQVIGELRSEGKTVVMTTHTPHLVKEVTSRWLNMEEGRLNRDDKSPPQ